MISPNNGTKTHPLTAYAWRALRDLESSGPMPAVSFNPGCINRLLRGELAEQYEDKSPFVSHKGKNTNFLRITLAGRLALKGRR